MLADEWLSFANVSEQQKYTNKQKIAHFIKYSWKYSSVCVMVSRVWLPLPLPLSLPLPFCHVTLIHWICDSCLVKFSRFISIYSFAFRQKTWAVRKSCNFCSVQRHWQWSQLSQIACNQLIRHLSMWCEFRFKIIDHFMNCVLNAELRKQRFKLEISQTYFKWFNWWLIDRDG